MPSQPKVRLFHWKAEEAAELVEKLKQGGYRVVYQASPGGASRKTFSDIAAVVIDLSRIPSNGRAVAAWIRGSKTTRQIPILFVGGEPVKVKAIRDEIPDAAYAEPAKMLPALKKIIGRPANPSPVVPPQMMDSYGNRTVAQKLGIMANTNVRLIDPPSDYERILSPLPDGVALGEDSKAAVTLWFVRDSITCQTRLPQLRSLALASKFWIVWPKGNDKITANEIRKTAADLGLVDYKVCSLGNIWSGVAFSARKAPKAAKQASRAGK